MGASAVILVVVGYMSWRRSRDVTPPTSRNVMLAVLPFENLTGDPNKEYLADGLTEETISQLGQLNSRKQLSVIGSLTTKTVSLRGSPQRFSNPAVPKLSQNPIQL